MGNTLSLTFASQNKYYLLAQQGLVEVCMPRAKQLQLFEIKTKTAFGGSLNQGKRKEARPLDSTRPVHLIFKADQEDLLLANREMVERVLRHNAGKLGVKIRSIAVNADHIHLVIGFLSRDTFNKWIRGVTGVLARKIKGLSWRQLPYTEILNWGRHLRRAENYVEENRSEAEFILTQHECVTRWKSRVEESVANFKVAGQSQVIA